MQGKHQTGILREFNDGSLSLVAVDVSTGANRTLQATVRNGLKTGQFDEVIQILQQFDVRGTNPPPVDSLPADLKTYALQFVSDNFGINLSLHPAIWEELYDLFKSAIEQGFDLGYLIRIHLMSGTQISNAKVMILMQSAHEILGRLLIRLLDQEALLSNLKVKNTLPRILK